MEEIEGLAEMEAKLHNLSRNVVKRVLRNAGKDAGELFKDGIQENIERQGLIESGFMEDSVRINTRVTDGFLNVMVGPSDDIYPLEHGRTKNRDANEVAFFSEFGTSKEAARPFMRPAFDANSDRAIEVFVEELSRQLNNL
jgi:HK97 gp10 family phage protein